MLNTHLINTNRTNPGLGFDTLHWGIGTSPRSKMSICYALHNAAIYIDTIYIIKYVI